MRTMRVEGFEPIPTSSAVVVVLGTMPGGYSLRLPEYLRQEDERVLGIIGDMLGASRALPYEQRVALLIRRGVAVWDVLRSADRKGSTDAEIVMGSEVANDFNAFFREHVAIRRIYFNGGQPEQYSGASSSRDSSFRASPAPGP